MNPFSPSGCGSFDANRCSPWQAVCSSCQRHTAPDRPDFTGGSVNCLEKNWTEGEAFLFGTAVSRLMFRARCSVRIIAGPRRAGELSPNWWLPRCAEKTVLLRDLAPLAEQSRKPSYTLPILCISCCKRWSHSLKGRNPQGGRNVICPRQLFRSQQCGRNCRNLKKKH